MDPKKMHKLLALDTANWVKDGIISQEQQAKILARYVPKQEEPETSKLPMFMFGLATVLIALALVWYCAANWDAMSKVTKLAQIFAVVIGLYTAAYYFLVEKPSALGRVFIVLAIISFGVAIALIAQIYHISSHPTNGVLIWAIAALATSWIVKEHWGLIISIFLFGLWHNWEVVQYNNASLWFIVMLVVLGMACYCIRSRFGMVLLWLLSILWIIHANALSLEPAIKNIPLFQNLDNMILVRAISLLFLPFGVMLVAISRYLEGHEFWDIPGKLLGIIGWLCFFYPLCAFFIPWDTTYFHYGWYRDPGWLHFSACFNHPTTVFIIVEYVLFVVIAAGLIGYRFYKGEKVQALASVWMFALPGVFFPVNPGIWYSLAMILGSMLGFFVMLYLSVVDNPTRRWERILGNFIMGYFIVHEAISALSFGASSYHYSHGSIFLGYLSAFLLFLLGCVLIRQCLRILLPDEQTKSKALTVFITIVAFIILYTASFTYHRQMTNIWQDIPDVSMAVLMLREQIKLLGMIVFGLYVFLLTKSKDRRFLYITLSMFVLVLASTAQNDKIGQVLIFNLILLLAEIAMIYYSVILNSRALAIIGTIFFIIHMWTRHFDQNWGLMAGAGLFFATGAALMAAGWLMERNRKKLIALKAQAAAVTSQPAAALPSEPTPPTTNEEKK